MALIDCMECEAKVSDQAISCPHCGFPIKDKSNESDQKTVLIEKTSKDIKEQYALSLTLCLISAFITFYLILVDMPKAAGFVGIITLCTAVWNRVIAASEWWEHG